MVGKLFCNRPREMNAICIISQNYLEQSQTLVNYQISKGVNWDV